MILGIDIGTSSVKSMVIDLSGHILGIAQQEYAINIPTEGYAEQDPETWWEIVCSTCSNAIRQSSKNGSEIKAVGLSGQMHGLVAIDASANIVRPAIIWCDQRTISQKEKVETLFSKEELGELIQNPVATGFQLLSLLWMQEHDQENYKKIYKVLTPKDYIRYRLTGEIGSEMSDASGTAAFSVAGKQWSFELLERVGIDPDLFPAVRYSWEVSGAVTQEAASQSLLCAGIPVVFGGADQPMQAVGNGIINPGVVSCTLGTGGQLLAPILQPTYDPKLRVHTYVHSVPDRWYLLGATMSAGLSLKWLAHNILKTQDFNILDESASQIHAGSEGLLFLPYLIGDRTPHMDPNAKGMFFGLQLNHRSDHMVRAVLEGVAYSQRDGLEIFKSLNVQIDRVIVSGGGARSPLWKQILADVFGQEVYTSSMTEHACVGAAITAAVGVGLYTSFEEACSGIIKMKEEPVVPNAANQNLYDNQYGLYKELYQKNKQLFALSNSPK
ncbi:xylulokinase [Paenibacillus sp. FSL A5-0031]|uniref:xylulokinase n=1 Tax=Paenibacillus sp. FSL A5-0031 TaxID=1920420 RepID=UPI00096EADAA|nr:xylulokinase [Paenibacillus sp. FSL A5-0031]OME74111.1 xylulokinase [Paenibacillus sp. FSL A5-0031]